MVAIFEIQPTADNLRGSCAPVRSAKPVRGAKPVRSAESVRNGASPSVMRPVMRTILVGVALIAVLFAGLVSASMLNSPPAPIEAAGEFHVVSEGDTLYSVATSWNPQVPVAEVIEQISALNGGLDVVAVGDVISLPMAVR